MGRPRKAGNRTKSGRRSKVQLADKGCDGVIRRRALYAANDDGKVDPSQTFDALGRAWSAGLLGEGVRARDLLDGGRAIAARYWRAYGFRTPDSLAKFQPMEGGGVPDPVWEKAQERWLNDCLADVTKLGHAHRCAFDNLVIDKNPDHGPPMLDRIIFARRSGRAVSAMDSRWLERALQALDKVC